MSVFEEGDKCINTSEVMIFNFGEDGELKSIENPVSKQISFDKKIVLYNNYKNNNLSQTLKLFFDKDYQLNGNYYSCRITQYKLPSSTKIFHQNGYAAGYFESFTNDNSGTIFGLGSNGCKIRIAKIAATVFRNNQDLTTSDNIFFSNNNVNNIAPDNVKAHIVNGCLEVSNVDINDEKTAIDIIH